jgi:hypothetical protein
MLQDSVDAGEVLPQAPTVVQVMWRQIEQNQQFEKKPATNCGGLAERLGVWES